MIALSAWVVWCLHKEGLIWCSCDDGRRLKQSVCCQFTAEKISLFCIEEKTMLLQDSQKGDIVLQAHAALLRLTVCRELMPHNNRNLRFALYKSLFDVSQAHAGFGPLVVLWLHTFFLQSLLCSSWWAQWSHFTFKAHQTPSQVRQAFRTPPHGCIKRKRLNVGASEDLHLRDQNSKVKFA